ncbi:hypothetical protein BDF20DRAFT_237820 [Mycotypha africana]|uniref:uncharacterized protein n=1 Tax=Mycotypha africana TaxID=64632 RepID=UPI002301F6BC|nr:uncharacterized protein BDF20DRAFT_237820 [Mycotypha africana]KAI8967234.1 hypothetical protein BDF20DRAFT_237820 [Mycotypha africana]
MDKETIAVLSLTSSPPIIGIEQIRNEILSSKTQAYFRYTATVLVYMSICLGCCIWQIMTAIELVYTRQKWLHFAAFFETLLCFILILCSILNPLNAVGCEDVSITFTSTTMEMQPHGLLTSHSNINRDL